MEYDSLVGMPSLEDIILIVNSLMSKEACFVEELKIYFK